MRVSLCKFYDKMFSGYWENDRFFKIFFFSSISKSWPIHFNPLQNVSPILLLNDTDMKQLCFSISSTIIYWNRSLAACDLFHIFTQSFKLYPFYCHILKGTGVWERDLWNRQKMNDSSGRIWVGFCLNTRKRFHFKANRQSIVSSQKRH